MKIGIIGTGRHGSRYAGHIVNDCPSLQLTAISRRSPNGRDQARAWQCRWFADWHELVACRQVEAVICAVPPIENQAIAACCAAHGKPLLVEKPLAVDGDAGAAMVRELGTKNVALTVGQTLRYNPVIRRLREHLPEMGRLHTVYANQRLEPSTLAWLDEPSVAGAGVTLHIAVHVFDALQVITGLKITRVSASCRSVLTKNLEDLALIRVELEGGVAGLIEISKLSPARSGRYELVCSGGLLHGDQIHGQVSRLSVGSEPVRDCFPPTPTIVPLLRDWQRFLQGRGPNPVTGEDGLYAVRVAEACLQSSASGTWIDVETDFR
ncbi:MAG: Gfo/Idh/MocA family oxidoreductase [Desulfofustis sp.]|nr:Gfo/Idh/MocA family oxidoreductase [Desulfofustis sp.]